MRQDLMRVLACPGCGRPLSQESNDLGCDRGHTFPIIDGVPCFLPPDMMPSDVETAGLRAFERHGRIYSWAVTHWENLGLREIIGPAPTRGTSLLCLGGGDSEERHRVEQLGYTVTSLDIDPIDGIDMLADGHALPLRDHQFDVVTSFEVFEHLTAPWLAIKEVARVLRPGGRFVGSVAFMKPFHGSYFHMSHKGVIALLESAHLELDRIYGGQNPFIHVMGRMLPLGPRRISNRIYGALHKVVMSARRNTWRIKNRTDPAAPTDRYDATLRLSLDDYEKLRFGAAIIFSATKS